MTDDNSARKLSIGVPAGIGDISWIWSKLYAVRDRIAHIYIVDGKPRRSADFVKLLGVPVSYADGIDGRPDFGYDTICANMVVHKYVRFNPLWKQLESRWQEGVVLTQANTWLEDGNRLEDWMPDLPVEWHYPLAIEERDKRQAARMIAEVDGLNKEHLPVLAFSCASYQGSSAWQTWDREPWVDFLGRARSHGFFPVAIGGSWDDLTYTVSEELELPNLVGRSTVGCMVELLNSVEAYVGFSSGMNVLRTVLDRPAMALWPNHQKDLSTTWAPTHMLDSQRYVASLYRAVADVWPVAKRFLDRCAREATDGRPERPS